MENLFHICLYLLNFGISFGFGKPANNISIYTTAKPISEIFFKFHQNDYKLIFERAELVRSDANLVKAQVRTSKYNRTTPVIIASFTPKIDVNYDMEVIVQTYKFASNEYREFPLRFQCNLCDAIASSAMGFADFRSKYGNIVCPLLKDKTYYINNFSPNEQAFPPFIPSGRYMLQMQFLYQSKEAFVTNNYGTVDRPII